jgi:predicted transcriptional regulator
VSPAAASSSAQPERRGAGELEAQILGALWAADSELTPADVLERLGGDLAYTTVAKVLDRLQLKGKVRRRRSGRSFHYAPVDAESSWVAGQVQRLLGRAGNRSAVLQGFVDGLDANDTVLLSALLEEAREREKPGDRRGSSIHSNDAEGRSS